MQRLRTLRRKARYTQLANDAIDGLPSLEAVGLLATILRHDDAFEFDMAILIKRKPNLGKTHAYNARRELIEHGYLVQLRFQHTHRGRFGTDIFRAAEPHTAEDLDELRHRYMPGAQMVVTDDDGAERVERVTWAEMTSCAGVEQLGATELGEQFGTELDASSVKPQVAPNSALPESGRPEVGQPTSGQAESFKEDCPVEDELEPPPSVPTAETQPAESEQPQEEEGEEGEEVPADVWDMLAGIPIPPGKRAPGRRSTKLAEVAARCAAIVHAPEQYGLRVTDLRQHLAADLDTVRHSVVSVWLHRLTDEQLPYPRTRTNPQHNARPLPPVCGQCDAREGDPVHHRIVDVTEADGNTRSAKCPRCNPNAKGASVGAENS